MFSDIASDAVFVIDSIALCVNSFVSNRRCMISGIMDPEYDAQQAFEADEDELEQAIVEDVCVFSVQ